MSYAATASAQRVRSAAEQGLYAGALGLGAAPVIAANGGFFPTSWGWAGAGLAWAALLAAVLGQAWRPSRLELAWVGCLAAVAGWMALSLIWTSTESGTAFELQRTFVYVAGALAVVTIVRRDQVDWLIGGVCTGAALICLYALSTRLFPSGNLVGTGFEVTRLSRPVGYWNGLAIVAVMGSLLALAAVAHGARVTRILAAASVPVFIVTLYFTFSRGGWLAFFVGLAVLFAVERRRLQLLGATLPILLLGGFGIWRASHERALSHSMGVTLQTATHEGRSLAAIVLGLCLVAGYVGYAMRSVEQVWELAAVVRAVRVAIAVVAVAVLGIAFARFGSPITIVRHGYDSFVSAKQATPNLNARVFSLSNNGRLQAWRVAWHGFVAHPLGGIGAGGFAGYWEQHRPVAHPLQDAHSLYLETLAETGVVGFVLLMAALLLPFAALRRARGNPFVAAAFAGYAAFLVQAAGEWDWELAGVTLMALLLGGAVLVAARSAEQEETPGRRWPALGLGSVLAAAALLGLAGNLLTSASAHAFVASRLPQAARDAHRATLLAPWSAPAWQHYAQAEHDLGHQAQALRAYRTAIARDPHNSHLWVDLALVSTGSARKAALDRAQQLNPLDSSIASIREELGGK